MISEWIRQSNKTVIFTGAGMSTESGLPDFRSAKQGMWRDKDPTYYASTYALTHHRDPFIQFYRQRIKGLLKVKPHEGHTVLAEWEKKGWIDGIVTQNVDGLHQAAGSKRVAALHGSLRELVCMECQKTYPAQKYETDAGTMCVCGGFIRPKVVLFGENLPEQEVARAEALIDGVELLIVLGSSLQVSPANFFPVRAKEQGAKLVIINWEPTDFDAEADLVVNGEKIGAWLQQVHAELLIKNKPVG
ncbi:NAD-dependent deacylase [Laceyella sacchari]|uniref:protein acetyllysine N-acetyltransferase n=1 Tax=Laceyella sacchari TaxID=37482 RepID=A0ABY5U572_LACSH|nr:NAD-dependent deacylase [Laceyella sacchari]KPC77725.1 NAD-dependent deacetylase [Thermoactinomyces vulgaris]UWE04792.1 NAD-dependent deacylase [Laceyella sacchari]